MLVISTITISTMHGSMNTKFINAKQATEIHAYKNTKRKLYKTKAAIWFNKVHTHTGLRAVTTHVCKPEAANAVGAPDGERHTARNMLSF